MLKLTRDVYEKVTVGAGLVLVSTMASASTGPWDAFFDEVDLSGVSAKVIAAGLLIIGIAMAFRGPVLAKRVVNKT